MDQKADVIEEENPQSQGLHTASVDNHETPLITSPDEIATWRFFIIIIGMNIGLFLALMDLSIISTAMYTISVEFKDYKLSIWALLSYTLADIGSVVFFTRLSDVFGRKTIVISSFFIFTVFSLACGFSRTAEQLVFFRTFQGIGGAGLYSLTMVVGPEISPPRFLPFVVGTLGCTVAVAGVSGPVLGGVITGHVSWRWIFWINSPFGVLAMVGLYFAWPWTKSKNIKDVMDSVKFSQLDFFGAILMALGSVLFITCLQMAGTRTYKWSSPTMIAMLNVTFASWTALFVWEWFLGRERQFKWMIPHLPFRLLTNRVMICAFLSTILTGFVQFLSVFSLPFRSQLVDLKSPVQAGIGLLPLVVSGAIGSMVGGGSSSVKNVTWYTMVCGTALMTIGTGLMTTLPLDGTITNEKYGFEVLIGFGIGMTVSTVTFMTSMEVEFRDHAVAQGTVAQCRIFGGSIGIAVSTIIMNNHLSSTLTSDPKLSLPADALQNLYTSPFRILEYGIEAALDFRSSYIQAFRNDIWMCTIVSIAAFLFAVATWHTNAPTVEQRAKELDVAVRAYGQSKKEAGVMEKRGEV